MSLNSIAALLLPPQKLRSASMLVLLTIKCAKLGVLQLHNVCTVRMFVILMSCKRIRTETHVPEPQRFRRKPWKS
jgi:hypothetical protein